jgi:hypothetical protein
VTEQGSADDAGPPSFPESLCHLCEARRYVRGRATTFVLCTALPEKYPRQPVLRCPAFRDAGGGAR